MIGQPLQKINHVCLADDYNKLVEVIKPYQNLQIGSGLNGYIAPNGISISVAQTNNNATFDFPFKVESTSLSSATIQFGRVFEERNFQGNEVSTITNLSFIELSSSVSFDPTSGMTLPLNSTLEKDSIIIAVDSAHESSLDKKFYSVCLSSSITADYYPAHVIANLTKETSGSGSWTIEQVLMGDYTFARNLPVPFDITRYNDKWLIYMPANSLVFNNTDITNEIVYLTYETSPVIGDWYEINPDNNWINIYNDSDDVGWFRGGYLTSNSLTDNDFNIKLFDKETGTETLITKQLVKGALNYDVIRTDAGPSYNTTVLYKSIATQGNTYGIDVTDNKRTIELHGFKNALEKQGEFTDDSNYSYKIPVREVDISTGITELRWTDVANLSAVTGSGNSDFDFPWKATYNSDTTNIDVIVGRVYDYQSFEDSASTDEQYAIDELEGITYAPLAVASITCGTGDFIGIYRDYTYPNKWEIGIGSTPPTNGILLQKICNVYGDGTQVEQIHMGDVNFNEPNLHAFSVARLNGDSVMYIPANSIVINGVDYTANAISNGGTAITSTSITDWYKLNSGNFYNIYIKMTDSTDGYGQVANVYIRETAPTEDGELITIPLFDPTLRRSYQTGSIFKEFIRTDSYNTQSTGTRRSLDLSITDGEHTGDRTMQLRNFKYADVNQGALDGSEGYDYSFITRELLNSNDSADIKYVTYAALSSSIAESIIISDTFTDAVTSIVYEELSGNYWEQDADYTINYGSSIGNAANTMVIDLSGKILKGNWEVDGNLIPTTSDTYNLGADNKIWIDGYIQNVYTSNLYGIANADISIQNSLAFPSTHTLGTATYPCGQLYVDGNGALRIGNVQVVQSQQAAIPDSDGTLSGNTAAINSILGALRTHGLIAT